MDEIIPFEISYNDYKIISTSSGLPNLYNEYYKHAEVVDEFDFSNDEGKFFFLGISRKSGWPFLVISQKYNPAGCGFNPGIFYNENSNLLFVGAGTRILCYDLELKQKLWEDTADFGFLHWVKYDDYILMSAELEFACWDSSGKKMWTTFVEPPWDFSYKNKQIILDIMGEINTFNIEKGP